MPETGRLQRIATHFAALNRCHDKLSPMRREAIEYLVLRLRERMKLYDRQLADLQQRGDPNDPTHIWKEALQNAHILELEYVLDELEKVLAVSRSAN